MLRVSKDNEFVLTKIAVNFFQLLWVEGFDGIAWLPEYSDFTKAFGFLAGQLLNSYVDLARLWIREPVFSEAVKMDELNSW